MPHACVLPPRRLGQVERKRPPDTLPRDTTGWRPPERGGPSSLSYRVCPWRWFNGRRWCRRPASHDAPVQSGCTWHIYPENRRTPKVNGGPGPPAAPLLTGHGAAGCQRLGGNLGEHVTMIHGGCDDHLDSPIFRAGPGGDPDRDKRTLSRPRTVGRHRCNLDCVDPARGGGVCSTAGLPRRPVRSERPWRLQVVRRQLHRIVIHIHR